MDVRTALIERMQKRMVRTREALDRFNDRTAERLLVSDDWNVRDLVGHLAHWTQEGAEQIPALAAGTEFVDYDIEKINDEVYRKNRRMSFVMLMPKLRSAEDRLIEAMRNVDEKLLVGDTKIREWIDALIKHYDYHWKGLSEAAERLE